MSDDSLDDDFLAGPASSKNKKPPNSVDNDKPAKKKKTSVEKIYQKKTQLEHIIIRPDTYIGSVEKETKPMWVWDENEEKMVYREITYVPGLYKIFDEILVNAADNKQRDPKMNCIKVDIHPEKNEVIVYNNGKGIPVVEHRTEKCFVPTLIFGHLLTSSNYDDDEKKVVGGRNGFGAKLCNIFSKKFKVETSCKDYQRTFSQVWTDNMKNTTDPKITPQTGEDFTRVTFQPDLNKFKMDCLDRDIVSLFSRRAFDVAGSTRGVRVFLNGKRLPVNGFRDYIDLFIKERQDDVGNPIKIVHEIANERWEIAMAVSDSGFQQISFVNSIATTRGGKHIDYIADQIVSKVVEVIKKKNKGGVTIKPFQVKNHLWVFVNCLIENPTFDSQTKETMTLQAKSFGSTCAPSEKFLAGVFKSGIVESVLTWAKFKAQTELSRKCHGKKQAKLTGIPKLEDANDAGTKNSIDCTLILTEGDSAKSLVVAGLGVVGRDKYGVFPLRGKLLNVREASHKQILDNVEINNIIKIVGLQYKKQYQSIEDMKTLRYGKIMIMTDQDQDGSHIKGLLINFIHHNWPSLLKFNFLEQFITPIVKASKGKEVHSFYSLPEFEEWKKDHPNWHTYKIKYYKGLGTSTSAEAKEYFTEMERHRIRFNYSGNDDDHFIKLAFSKKMVEQRKDWLTNSMEERKRRRELSLPEVYLYEKNTRNITFRDFVNKELILFSNMDNERSIPSLVDGLKPGQRKVLYTCFKRNDKREVKVAQLAGSVGEHSAYHHGEASLMSTIINLAQNFVGSNNINLLQPIGQFGTRLQGGKDAASPRYIFTMLSPLARKLFSQLDDPLLNYLYDDNLKIEPEYYVPIIPMVLVNGADGIGTGWSTKIPNFNPREIVTNIRRMMAGQAIKQMKPWFKGFTGTIEQIDQQRYIVNGEAALIDSKTLEITELPVRVWTQTYKETVLEPMLTSTEKNSSFINDYKEYHTDETVKFIILMNEDKLEKTVSGYLHKTFKIQSTLTTTTMVLFDSNGCLRKYETPEEILEEFYPLRLNFYVKRKAYYEGILEAEALKLENQARFITEKNDRIIVMENVKKKDFIQILIKRNYDSDPVKAWKKKNLEKTPEDSDGESDSGSEDSDKRYDFDYLIDMTMRSMLREKVQELLNTRDQKKMELEKLRASTPEDLWEEDLKQFLEELDRVEQMEKEQIKSGSSLPMKSTKSGRVKINKMIDFKPSPNGERISPRLDEAVRKAYPAAAKKAAASRKVLFNDKEKPLDNDVKMINDKPAIKTETIDKSDSDDEFVPLSVRLNSSIDKDNQDFLKRLDTILGKTTDNNNDIVDDDDLITKPKKKLNGTSKPRAKPAKKVNDKKKTEPKKKKFSSDSEEDVDNFTISDSDDDLDFDSKSKTKENLNKKEEKIQLPSKAFDSDDDDLYKKPEPQEQKKTSEELFDSLFTSPSNNNASSSTNNNGSLDNEDKKNNIDNGDDDDFFGGNKPEKKTKPKTIDDFFPKSKSTKSKKKILSDNSDDDDYDDELMKAKKPATKKAKTAAAKKPAKTTKKKKKMFDSEDDSDSEPIKKKKNKLPVIDESFNDIPPELLTKTGRIRQPVNYNYGYSSDDDI